MSRFMERFETTPGEHRPRPIRNGLVFLAVLVLIAYCGFTRSIPFLGKDGDEVKAVFASATNLHNGNLVRVQGVDVGEVTKIERDPSGKGALVTMRVKQDGFKLHQDAHAALYWRTLLARNMYIELNPGSNDLPKLGGTIPLKNTETQVEFDQLLDSYDEDGRAGIRTFFQQGDKTLDGPEAGQAIEHLGPGLKPVSPAMAALRGTQPGKDLPGLAKTAAQTLGALAKDENALGGIIDSGNMVLGVTAARRSDLAAMLQRAPASLRDTRTTLKRLRTTLDVLDPIAADLRPGLRVTDPAVDKATAALASLRTLTPKALPALKDLQPALASLRSASNQGSPLFKALDPTLARVNNEIVPFLDKTDSNTKLKNYEAIGPFFGALASSSSQFDANGHMQRFMPGQGIDSLGMLPCSITLFDPESDGQLLKCKQAISLLPQVLFGTPRKASGRKALTGRSAGR
jgi:virulence factor Mce-like protein